MDLKEFFTVHKKAAIACSGGVDSTFLVQQAKKYGADVKAYFVKSVFQPDFEKEDAEKCCAQVGVPLRIVNVDVLKAEKVRQNPTDRCYYCKRAIFEALWEAAREDCYPILLEGTNASDDAADRPGMRALQELSVLSPLRECGYSKDRIRAEAEAAGLFTFDKPAYACLATRIPCGMEVTGELLSRIESSEKVLFALGFHDFRVRVFHGAARLQLRVEEWPLFFEKRKEVTGAVSPYFTEIFLDTMVVR